MNLQSLELNNFRGVSHAVLPFDGKSAVIYGINGMAGTALVNNLKNIRNHKNQTRPAIHIDEIYAYDVDSSSEGLERYCAQADFVFHLAGVNRPENPADFMKGNFGFTSELLACLKNIIIKRQSCFSPRYRQTCRGDSVIRNMEEASSQGSSFFLIVRARLVDCQVKLTHRVSFKYKSTRVEVEYK